MLREKYFWQFKALTLDPFGFDAPRPSTVVPLLENETFNALLASPLTQRFNKYLVLTPSVRPVSYRTSFNKQLIFVVSVDGLLVTSKYNRNGESYDYHLLWTIIFIH